jgi:hypothetical protein
MEHNDDIELLQFDDDTTYHLEVYNELMHELAKVVGIPYRYLKHGSDTKRSD